MLATLRAMTKSWVTWVIFGLIGLSFLFVGGNMSGVIHPPSADWVIQAGDRSMGSAEFKRDFDNIKKQQEAQAQQQITTEQAVQFGFDRAVLEHLAGQFSMESLLTKVGIRPSDKLLAAELRKQPAFFNPISGAFDQDSYTRLLGQNGLTPTVYEAELRNEIAAQQFGIGASNGLRAPRAFTALLSMYGLESRDISYFTVDPRSVGQVPPPTDAQMQAFLAQNAQRLMLPEFRVLSVVRFSAAAASAGVKVDPAQVQKTFDFQKASLSTPETRSIIQISVKDQATAAAVAGRLQKGEDPAAVAKSLHVDPIVLTDKPKSAITDRRVADAAFGLAAGQSSGPVQGDLSWAVVKITRVTPGHAASIDEARPKIEQEIRQQSAQAQIYDQSQRFADAQQAGSNLGEAAQKAGAKAETLPAVTDKGVGQDGKPLVGIDPKLLKAAFALPSGGESEVEEISPGEYYAVRVEKIIAPAPPPLEKIRPQLFQYLMGQAVEARIKAKAADLAARLKKGESLEALAASVGGHVAHTVGLDRMSARQHAQDLGQELLSSAMNARTGDVFAASVPQPVLAVAVVRVDAVRPGDMSDLARFTEQQRVQLTTQMIQEIGDDQQAAAKTKFKTRTNLHQARVALGVDPEVIAKLEADAAPIEAGAKAGKKK